jgi:hypothetical protein
VFMSEELSHQTPTPLAYEHKRDKRQDLKSSMRSGGRTIVEKASVGEHKGC